MLRTVSSVPVGSSSPTKPITNEIENNENNQAKMDTNSEMLSNLDRNLVKDKRKKQDSNLSSDDENDDDINNIMSNEANEFIDEDEKNLEDLVFGSQKNILVNMGKNNAKKIKKSGLKFNQFVDDDLNNDKKTQIADAFETRKPVWDDENDEEELLVPEKLANKFMKYYGTPIWADLDSKNKRKKVKKAKKAFKLDTKGLTSDQSEDENDSEEDSDPEENTNFFQQTGNFLADSNRISSATSSLPKTNLDIKICTDANKEDPDKTRLKCIEFHPSARVMLTGGLDQRLTLFQIDGKKNSKIQSIFIDKFPIMAAHFTKDGNEIIIGSRHKNFYYYDMNSGKLVTIVPPVKALDEFQRHSISCNFEISPDNRFIAFLGSQGQIHLFSCKSKEWINTLKINDSCNALTFSSDSRYLFAFGDDKDVHVFDMNHRGHRSLNKFTDYGCLSGTSIAVSNNSQFIATGCKSGVVNIYNLNESLLQSENRNPKPLKSFMNLTTPCTSLKFNSTSEILAASSSYAENACKLIHVGSLSVFPNFPQNGLNGSTIAQIRIPQCIDFSINSGYFTIGNHKGNALLYRLKHYGSF